MSEKFDFPAEIEFKYVLMSDDNLKKDDLELTYKDLEYSYYEDDIIDLGQIVVEQIVLQVPVRPLCNVSCKGLCPVCGINLNIDKCDHETQQISSSFAALKNFKAKKER